MIATNFAIYRRGTFYHHRFIIYLDRFPENTFRELRRARSAKAA